MELFLAPYNVLETKLEYNLKTLLGKAGGREEDKRIEINPSLGLGGSRAEGGHLPGVLEAPSLISNTKEGTSRWSKPFLSCAWSSLCAQLHPPRREDRQGWVTFLSTGFLGSQISKEA